MALACRGYHPSFRQGGKHHGVQQNIHATTYCCGTGTCNQNIVYGMVDASVEQWWLFHAPCKPGVAGSIPGFSSPSDGTINRGPVCWKDIKPQSTNKPTFSWCILVVRNVQALFRAAFWVSFLPESCGLTLVANPHYSMSHRCSISRV